MMCYGGDVGIFSIGEFVNVRRRCGVLHRSAIVPTRFCGFGAGRARSNSEVFFFAAEIAAAKMLLFFRKPATMDILTKRGSNRCRDRCQSLPSADESIQRLLRSGMRSQSCFQSLGP